MRAARCTAAAAAAGVCRIQCPLPVCGGRVRFGGPLAELEAVFGTRHHSMKPARGSCAPGWPSCGAPRQRPLPGTVLCRCTVRDGGESLPRPRGQWFFLRVTQPSLQQSKSHRTVGSGSASAVCHCPAVPVPRRPHAGSRHALGWQCWRVTVGGGGYGWRAGGQRRRRQRRQQQQRGRRRRQRRRRQRSARRTGAWLRHCCSSSAVAGQCVGVRAWLLLRAPPPPLQQPSCAVRAVSRLTAASGSRRQQPPPAVLGHA